MIDAFGEALELVDVDGAWGSLDHHRILYVEAGCIHLVVPDGRYLVPPGNGAWVSADIRHRLVSRRASVAAVRLSPFVTPMPRLDACVFAPSPLARELIRAAQEWGPGWDQRDDVGGALFTAVALMCHRWMEAPRPFHLPGAQSPELERALAATLDHLGDGASLEVAAAAAGISPRTLARRFQAETRSSFRDFLRTARVLRAMELLAEPGARVGDVARAVGFTSATAFTRAFHALAGEGPRAHRDRR